MKHPQTFRFSLLTGVIITFLGFVWIGVGIQPVHPVKVSESGYLEVEKAKLWYAVLGEGKGTPLIMLHGGPGGTSNYLFSMYELAEERELIIFDQPGSGKSWADLDTVLMTPEYFVKQLDQLVEHLELDSFFIFGHSWGGTLALEYYLTHPDAVKAMILSSPLISTPLWLQDAEILLRRLPDSIRQFVAESKETGDFFSRKFMIADQMYADSFLLRTRPLANPYYDESPRFNARIYNYMWGPSEFTAPGTLRNYDRTADLPGVAIPVLFMTGEYDEARPETVSRFSEMVPQGEFQEIPGAGHATMYDNPEYNLKVIREFLRKLEN